MNDQGNLKDNNEIHELIGIVRDDPGQIQAKLQILGSNQIISKPVCDIYEDKSLLEKIPTIQGIFLGVLCHVQRRGDVHEYQNLSHNTLYYFKILPFLSMSFISIVILSLLVDTKLMTIGGIDFYASVLCYPFTHLLVALITEVYGFKYTRRLIWSSMFFNLFFLLTVVVSLHLTPSVYWHLQTSYFKLYSKLPRVIWSAMLSMSIGWFIQAYLLAKSKVKFRAKYLMFRIAFSMIIGMIFDCFIFGLFAYISILPMKEVLELIFTNILMKMVFLIIGSFWLPAVVEKVKWIDKMDYYDYQTKFNPFSISLEDRKF